MQKSFLIGALICILGSIIFLASDIKNAYKMLPGPTSSTLPPVKPFIEWLSFEPSSKLFKAQLPAVPQSAKQAVALADSNKKRRYEMFASEKMDGSLFMISLITYPSESNMSDSQEILKGVVEEVMQGNAENHLNQLDLTTFHDHQALKFDIKNKEFNVQGLTFLIDKIVYLLVYVAHQENVNAEDFKYFINSFEIGSSQSNND